MSLASVPTKTRVRVIRAGQLGLLALALVQNVWFSPMGRPLTETDKWVALAWIGAFYAQPALLAIWASLSDELFFVRFPRAVATACVLELAATWGARLNQERPLQSHDLASLVLPFMQFSLLCLVFSGIRVGFGWRVSGVRATAAPLEERHQFSMFHLMQWMSLSACILAAGVWLFRDYPVTALGSRSIWSEFAIAVLGGTTVGIFSIPIIFNLGIVLGDQVRWSAVNWCVAAFLFQLVAIVILMVILGGLKKDCGEVFTVLISFHITTFVILTVLRGLGFSLRTTLEQA